MVSIFADFPFHGFLYELQNFQGQSFEFVLIFLIEFHLQLQQQRQAGFRCIYCSQCDRGGEAPHEAAGGGVGGWGGRNEPGGFARFENIPFFAVAEPHIPYAH